jgi:hypothetical protein
VNRKSRCRRSSIPYARADFFLAFGEEGVELEEGFATLTELPGDLQVKVGKMRAAFGKVNTLHTHVLPWADRPLVINNLLGGEEGISDAGVSVARLIPIGNVFFEATGQVFRGDGRLEGALQVEQARRRELRRTSARLFRPHRIDESRFWRVLLAGPQRRRRRRRCRSRPVHHATVRRRRHVPVAAADARDYHQFVARTEYIRSDREQSTGCRRPTASMSPATINSRAAGGWADVSINPNAPTMRRCSIAASRSRSHTCRVSSVSCVASTATRRMDTGQRPTSS